MGNFDINPFNRAALYDSRLLAGRINELRKVRFILRTSAKLTNRFQNIIISGTRGVGKTSFLNLIEADAKVLNLVIIRLDLTTSSTINANEFFWLLFKQTTDALFENGLFGGKTGEIKIALEKIIDCNQSEDPATWVFKTPLIHRNYLKNNNIVFEFDQLINDLKLIKNELSTFSNDNIKENAKIIYLVDESHLIYSKREIIEAIRFMVQNQNLGIGFVFAGDGSYESSEWENVFGGSYRDFEIIKLDYFNDVDDVIDFFKRSLDYIGWTSEEIENTLFYRMKHTCQQIFNLTSGKPEWINTIAKKMFDRCMVGDSRQLKFDKDTQIEVKEILESGGKIDKTKINYIENLLDKNDRWITKIFASEFSTLNDVYFYGKFLLTDKYFMTKTEFRSFCQDLIDKGIVYLLKQVKSKSTLGYDFSRQEPDFLDVPYITFGLENETIKHWLQIRYEGKYRFGFKDPGNGFIESINKDLAADIGSFFVATSEYEEGETNPFRYSTQIKKINNNCDDILNEAYIDIYYFYRACKRISVSNTREVLFAELINHKSKKVRCWNIVNFNEKDKVIGFYDNPRRIAKYKSNIEHYNDEDTLYSLNLVLEKVDIPNMDRFQNLILKSGDKKKYGIIIADKMTELLNHYIGESNVIAAEKEALFFFELFEEGYDLKVRELNNAGYVFFSRGDIDKSDILFKEGIRKIKNDEFENEELNQTFLLLYNSGILKIKVMEYEKALSLFKSLIQVTKEHENVVDTAEVLNILEIDDDKNIIIKEIRENDIKYTKISCSIFAKHNIEILSSFLKLPN